MVIPIFENTVLPPPVTSFNFKKTNVVLNIAIKTFLNISEMEWTQFVSNLIFYFVLGSRISFTSASHPSTKGS